jgi:hypothetical protein
MRGKPAGMSERGMADDSSEQVPGQQTDESSLHESNRGADSADNTADEGLGRGPHAGEGSPA